MKQIQISEKLFLDLVRYFVLDFPDEELHEDIKKAVEEKTDKVISRELYSKYNNAKLSASERESARIRYLQHKDINTDFIWPENFKP